MESKQLQLDNKNITKEDLENLIIKKYYEKISNNKELFSTDLEFIKFILKKD